MKKTVILLDNEGMCVSQNPIYSNDVLKVNVQLNTRHNKVSFSSSDPKIATIDNQGIIKTSNESKIIIDIAVDNSSFKQSLN